jgi:Transposase protein
VLSTIAALVKELKAEKQKNKELREDAKNLSADKKILGKTVTELQVEKMKLREQMEAAGGAFSIHIRDKIIRDALEPIFSPAQCDRLLLKKGARRWTEDDYAMAISFLCRSTRGYRYARDILKLPLPAVSSVKAKIAKFPLTEGLATFALKIMQARGLSMSELQKICVLTFDEIYINSNMVYDSVEDQVLGPNNKTQVVMAQGLFGGWKNIVYFDHNKDVTKDILIQVITELSSAGFTVVAVNCDMGIENRKLYSNLGVNEQTPSFPHPVTGVKIACFHDSPHLVKLARNHLVDHGMTLNPTEPEAKQQHATKDPIVELLTKAHLVELHAHNMTWRHLEAKQCDRQIVRLAAQVLSNKTYVCICAAAKEGLLSSPDCFVSFFIYLW